MKRHFFKRYQGRGSYNLFSSYSHYLPGVKGMMGLLLLFFIGGIIGNLSTIGLTAAFGKNFTADYGTIISYPIMFIPVMLYASMKSRLDEYRTPDIPLDKGGFSRKEWMTIGFAGVFSTIALAYITEPVVTLLPEMPEWLENTMKMVMEDMPLWATLLSVAVFAPLFEEWLCRGLVLRGLLHSMRPAPAIIISAIFFAILHMNPWQAIPAISLGILFGYVYYRTGSLKLTMLMHCTNNLFAVFFSKIPQFKDAQTMMDVLSPWAYWSIFAACVVIVICSTMLFGKSPSQHQKSNV